MAQHTVTFFLNREIIKFVVVKLYIAITTSFVKILETHRERRFIQWFFFRSNKVKGK